MKILVGLSGGVDSAAAARLLIDKGFAVEGAVLIMHEYTELSAARSVAASLGIPLHEIDCRDAFSERIKTNFVSEYLAGRTPNPCIICNAEIKFKYLADYARANGFDGIATGHYARVVALGNGKHAVAVAKDIRKDQSYMLCRLTDDVLSILHLPLSEMTKPEIRAYAASVGIPVAEKSDSLEICFLPEGDHAQYIESVAGKSPEGDFVDPEGNVIGRHNGIIRYTVGQRKGLGVSLGSRAFVTDIDPDTSRITLAKSPKTVTEIIVTDAVFSGIEETVGRSFSAEAKLRYSSTFIPTTVTLLGGGRAELHFDTPVTAAPGQSAVVYLDGIVLFGGFISASPNSTN